MFFTNTLSRKISSVNKQFLTCAFVRLDKKKWSKSSHVAVLLIAFVVFIMQEISHRGTVLTVVVHLKMKRIKIYPLFTIPFAVLKFFPFFPKRYS